MNTNNLRNIARSLKFKISTTKDNQMTNVQDSDTIGFSAYKTNENVCVRISNHRTNIVTWINEFKEHLPSIGISLVFLCTNKDLNEYEGNCYIEKSTYQKYKSLLDKFVIYEYIFDFTKFKLEDAQQLIYDIQATLNNKRFSINPVPQKSYFSPIIIDGKKRSIIKPMMLENFLRIPSNRQLYESLMKEIARIVKNAIEHLD